MRGFFAIGAEGISKPMNLGNLMRSAHAFGASFVFTIDAHKKLDAPGSDTSNSPSHIPYYHWQTIADMVLPQNCKLVGVELLDEAVDLPSFRHPLQAAYVLGPERGSLSSQMVQKCDHIIKIPTSFCINVAPAGAIIMYDRIKTIGRFSQPPVSASGRPVELKPHLHGTPPIRTSLD